MAALDRDVATKVMGWRVSQFTHKTGLAYVMREPECLANLRFAFLPSRSDSDAMEIIDTLTPTLDVELSYSNGSWKCCFYRIGTYNVVGGYTSRNRRKAICRAALAACEG